MSAADGSPLGSPDLVGMTVSGRESNGPGCSLIGPDPGKLSALKTCAGEVSAAEIGLGEVSSAKIGIAEARFAQGSIRQVGFSQGGACEVGSLKVGSVEFRLVQRRTF